MRKEIQAINQLCIHPFTHENLVTVFQHDLLHQDQSTYFIDTEYCFATFRDLINGKCTSIGLPDWPKSSIDQRLAYLATKAMDHVLQGLQFIHERGKVHRDITPKNCKRSLPVELNSVLYSYGKGLWKIADVGLTSDGTTTLAIHTEGGYETVGYKAPEILLKQQFTNRSDIWAVGCILFDGCSSLRRAFSSDIETTRFAERNGDMSLALDGLAEPRQSSLIELTRKTLDINPGNRSSAEDLRALLGKLYQNQTENKPWGSLGWPKCQACRDRRKKVRDPCIL